MGPFDGENTPGKLAELKKKAEKAQAEYERASGEKEKADAKKLRCGSYEIGQGSPRPFVYVPEGFDLNAHPAAKEILVQRTEEALILQIASISQLALRLDEKRALDGAYEDEDARGSRRSDAGKSSE